MTWEILPFRGMGPIRFDMSPVEVAAMIGQPESIDEEDDGYVREYRGVELPIISYENNVVVEIEAFRDVKDVTFRGRSIFGEPGPMIMRFLEEQNGGARANVGTVLFNDIGISCGRLDESSKGDHSITAFAKALWDDRIDRFKKTTFL